jgi:hypothetical protein
MSRKLLSFCKAVGALLLLASPVSAQRPNPSSLSPTVKEFVKLDDPVIALTHVTVFPGIVGMHNHLYYPQPTNMEGRRREGRCAGESHR